MTVKKTWLTPETTEIATTYRSHPLRHTPSLSMARVLFKFIITYILCYTRLAYVDLICVLSPQNARQ